MTTALVTGAAGYVGQRLARRLAEDGVSVRALCRSQSWPDVLRHPNITVVMGDVTDLPSIEAAVGGCDAIYHVAALARVWSPDPGEYRRVNVEGTLGVVRAAQSAGVPRVVITSTAGVFGQSDQGTVDETSRRDTPFSTPYERSKAEMQACLPQVIDGRTTVTVVCPTRIYGPGPNLPSNPVTRMIDLYRQGKWHFIPGDGLAIGNYVFIDDVVDGHIRAIEHGRSGEAYILGGENVSYRQLFDALAAVTGKRLWLVPLPSSLILGTAWIETRRAAMFGGQPLVTPDWARRLLANWAVSSGKAEQELRYRPMSVKDGIGRTVAWLATQR